jgi:hypothetical protein
VGSQNGTFEVEAHSPEEAQLEAAAQYFCWSIDNVNRQRLPEFKLGVLIAWQEKSIWTSNQLAYSRKP